MPRRLCQEGKSSLADLIDHADSLVESSWKTRETRVFHEAPSTPPDEEILPASPTQNKPVSAGPDRHLAFQEVDLMPEREGRKSPHTHTTVQRGVEGHDGQACSWLAFIVFTACVLALIANGYVLPYHATDYSASGEMEASDTTRFHLLQYVADMAINYQPISEKGPIRLAVVGGEFSTLADEVSKIAELVQTSTTLSRHGIILDAFLALRLDPSNDAPIPHDASIDLYNATVRSATQRICNATMLATELLTNSTRGTPITIRVHDPRFPGDPCAPPLSTFPDLRSTGKKTTEYHSRLSAGAPPWDPTTDLPKHIRAHMAATKNTQGFADVVVFRDPHVALGNPRPAQSGEKVKTLTEALNLMVDLMREHSPGRPPPIGGIAEVVGAEHGQRNALTLGIACGSGLVPKQTVATPIQKGNETRTQIRVCAPAAGPQRRRMAALCKAAKSIQKGTAVMRAVTFRRESMANVLEACEEELIASKRDAAGYLQGAEL